MGDALTTQEDPAEAPLSATLLRVILRLTERLLRERGVEPWDQDRLEALAGELAGADPTTAIRAAGSEELDELSDEQLQHLRFFAEEVYESHYWVETSEDASSEVSHEDLWAEIRAA